MVPVRFATFVLLLASVLPACSRPEVVRTRPIVRLTQDQFVANLSEPLVEELRRSLPAIDVRLVEGSPGSTRAAEAIERGEADLGFAQADVAYFAYRRFADEGKPDTDQLRGMAALEVTPLHLIVRPGANIDGIDDLRGGKVRMGPASTGQALLTELVVRAYGLGPQSFEASPLSSALFPDALEHGTVDAAFTVGYYPVETVVQATKHGARLVSIEGAIPDRLRREYPFIRRVVIPARTYAGQHDPINTIGVGRALICRRDLDEQVVHDLTKHFLEALPRLSSALGTSIRTMNLAEAAATPIPLHPGAARYYREWELTR